MSAINFFKVSFKNLAKNVRATAACLAADEDAAIAQLKQQFELVSSLKHFLDPAARSAFWQEAEFEVVRLDTPQIVQFDWNKVLSTHPLIIGERS